MPLEDTTANSLCAFSATAEHLSPTELSWVLTLNLNAPDLSDFSATFSTTEHTTKARKHQDRMLSNRLAAYNSRKRKKALVQTLEDTVKQLQETNQELLEQIRIATLENNKLKANINCK
jgi:hypothetical protein